MKKALGFWALVMGMLLVLGIGIAFADGSGVLTGTWDGYWWKVDDQSVYYNMELRVRSWWDSNGNCYANIDGTLERILPDGGNINFHVDNVPVDSYNSQACFDFDVKGSACGYTYEIKMDGCWWKDENSGREFVDGVFSLALNGGEPPEMPNYQFDLSRASYCPAPTEVKSGGCTVNPNLPVSSALPFFLALLGIAIVKIRRMDVETKK